MIAPVFKDVEGRGAAIVGAWPDEMLITREFLEDALPQYVSRNWRTVTLRPINSIAAYRITAKGPYPRTYRLIRL